MPKEARKVLDKPTNLLVEANWFSLTEIGLVRRVWLMFGEFIPAAPSRSPNPLYRAAFRDNY